MQSETAGAELAHALAAKDFDAVRGILHRDVDFRGMTPSRSWEATGPDAVIGVLQRWFAESDEIRSLDLLDTDAFADRERVGYRFSGTNPDGPFVVEQQAYLAVDDGRIAWMRVLCSGFRPAPPAGAG